MSARSSWKGRTVSSQAICDPSVMGFPCASRIGIPRQYRSGKQGSKAMIPRVGEPVRRDMRYRQRTGVYAILPRDGAVLLTHQAEPLSEFQLPGGGIDAGESPVAALHREVFEETGWRIARPIRVGAFRRFTYMPEYDLWA